jgi:hypothetical protein
MKLLGGVVIVTVVTFLTDSSRVVIGLGRPLSRTLGVGAFRRDEIARATHGGT